MSATTGSTDTAIPGSSRRRGYILTAGMFVAVMMGGTLPIPLYVYRDRSASARSGDRGLCRLCHRHTVRLLTLGDLSDHIGRRPRNGYSGGLRGGEFGAFPRGFRHRVVDSARIVSGLAAGFVTGTAAAALAEVQPARRPTGRRGGLPSGSNMEGLGLGPLIAGIFAGYVAMPTKERCSGATWAFAHWRLPRSSSFPRRSAIPTV